jgi:chaperonin GroES
MVAGVQTLLLIEIKDSLWQICIKIIHLQKIKLKKCHVTATGTKSALWHYDKYLNLKIYLKDRKSMSNVKLKPLADRVLVQPAAAEEKTASGIIIPDTAKEKPQKGSVVAVGTGKKDEPLTVKVGDTVLYGKYSGTEISVEGKDYLIMRESDIFAIL